MEGIGGGIAERVGDRAGNTVSAHSDVACERRAGDGGGGEPGVVGGAGGVGAGPGVGAVGAGAAEGGGGEGGLSVGPAAGDKADAVGGDTDAEAHADLEVHRCGERLEDGVDHSATDAIGARGGRGGEDGCRGVRIVQHSAGHVQTGRVQDLPHICERRDAAVSDGDESSLFACRGKHLPRCSHGDAQSLVQTAADDRAGGLRRDEARGVRDHAREQVRSRRQFAGEDRRGGSHVVEPGVVGVPAGGGDGPCVSIGRDSAGRVGAELGRTATGKDVLAVDRDVQADALANEEHDRTLGLLPDHVADQAGDAVNAVGRAAGESGGGDVGGVKPRVVDHAVGHDDRPFVNERERGAGDVGRQCDPPVHSAARGDLLSRAGYVDGQPLIYSDRDRIRERYAQGIADRAEDQVRAEHGRAGKRAHAGDGAAEAGVVGVARGVEHGPGVCVRRGPADHFGGDGCLPQYAAAGRHPQRAGIQAGHKLLADADLERIHVDVSDRVRDRANDTVCAYGARAGERRRGRGRAVEPGVVRVSVFVQNRPRVRIGAGPADDGGGEDGRAVDAAARGDPLAAARDAEFHRLTDREQHGIGRLIPGVVRHAAQGAVRPGDRRRCEDRVGDGCVVNPRVVRDAVRPGDGPCVAVRRRPSDHVGREERRSVDAAVGGEVLPVGGHVERQHIADADRNGLGDEGFGGIAYGARHGVRAGRRPAREEPAGGLCAGKPLRVGPAVGTRDGPLVRVGRLAAEQLRGDCGPAVRAAAADHRLPGRRHVENDLFADVEHCGAPELLVPRVDYAAGQLVCAGKAAGGERWVGQGGVVQPVVRDVAERIDDGPFIPVRGDAAAGADMRHDAGPAGGPRALREHAGTVHRNIRRERSLAQRAPRLHESQPREGRAENMARASRGRASQEISSVRLPRHGSHPPAAAGTRVSGGRCAPARPGQSQRRAPSFACRNLAPTRLSVVSNATFIWGTVVIRPPPRTRRGSSCRRPDETPDVPADVPGNPDNAGGAGRHCDPPGCFSGTAGRVMMARQQGFDGHDATVLAQMHRASDLNQHERASGGTGRRAGFRILWGNPSGFDSRLAQYARQ